MSSIRERLGLTNDNNQTGDIRTRLGINTAEIAPIKKVDSLSDLKARRKELSSKMATYGNKNNKRDILGWLFGTRDKKLKNDKTYKSMQKEYSELNNTIEDLLIQQKQTNSEKFMNTVAGNVMTAGKGIESTINKVNPFSGFKSTSTGLTYEERKAQEALNQTESKIGRTGLSILGSTARMIPQMAVGNPIGALAAGFANYGGGAYNEAKREGKSEADATKYGMAIGTLEMGLQNVLGGLSSIYGKSALSSVSNKVMQNVVKNPQIRNYVANIGSEGLEEYLQDILNPVVRNVTMGEKNKVKAFTPEALESGILGALTAGLIESPTLLSKNTTKTQINAPIKDNTEQTNVQNNVNIPIKQEQVLNVPQNKSNNIKEQQLDIINKNNPMADDYHTGIRSIEDIKTSEEAFTEENFEETSYPDFTFEDSQKAIKEGKIIVYSSKPIENGGFVSTSKMMAQDYSGDGKIYSKEALLNDIAWIDNNEGQYTKINNQITNENIAPIKKDIDIPIQQNTKQNTIERLKQQKETKITDKYNKNLQKNVKEATKDLNRVLYFDNTKQKEEFKETLENYSKNNKNATLEEITNDIKNNFSEKIIKNTDEDLRQIKKEVRKYKFRVDEDFKKTITDYNDFRKSNFGRLNLTKEGQEIDVAYAELSDRYPNIFDENIINKTDQLERISEFMKEDITTIEKYNLGEDLINESANYVKSFLDSGQNLDELIDSIDISSKEVRKAKNEEYRNLAKGYIANIITWKDKPRGINYEINTMERNFRDIIPDKAESKAIISEYIKPITESNAKANDFINSYNEVIKELNLSKIESTAVQMLGEYKYNPETELTGLQIEKFVSDNKLDINKITNSVETFRNIYDDLILEINSVLKEQGYKEIPYRKGYFPHFINDKQTNIIKKLAEKFGWKFKNMNLPTDIAGMTDIFTPGKTWFRNAQQRTGKATDYNALEGFDNYIRGAADIIFHTENIQKLRNLENQIRYQYSDKGTQEEIDKIYEDDTLTLEEKEEKANIIYDRIENQMPNLVTELRRYTNGIANKKDISDRSMEQKLGRETYNTMTNIQSRLSGNMIGLNISSALTNFIPLTQAYSQISTKNMLKATQQTIKSYYKDDGFSKQSIFLNNRTNQPERLYQTGVEKATDIAGIMFKGIDDITSNIIVRGKYLENIEKGMNEAKALENADQFAKNVIAGRDKGSIPTIFNQKNPIIKLFTSFQLEVNNQYGYMFKDLPDDKAKEGIIKLTMAFAKMFFAAWIYNKIKESITGTKSAFSPIDLLEDTIKISTNKNLSVSEKTTKFGEDIARELPFVGGLLGGGRLPISAALPDITKTKTSISNLISGEGNQEAAANTLKKEIMKPVAYLVLPFGGGQIKKTVEGLGMYNKEVPGSYTASGKLRFPVKEDLGSKIKAGIFGQYSSKEAREYFDNNYSPLGERQIEEYKNLDIPVKKYWEYRESLSDTGNVKDKFELITDLPYTTKQKNIMINNAVKRKEKIDLQDYKKYDSYEEFDFAVKNKEKYNSLKELGVSYKEYTKNKEEFDYAITNPIKYKISKYITEYSKYSTYKDKIKEVKNGTNNKKISVIKYVNSLSLSIPQKAMLIKTEYSSFDDYNQQIVEYINKQKISKNEKVDILKELGFKVNNDKVGW